jgi:tetratricopeptide (TPR) repeat protein
MYVLPLANRIRDLTMNSPSLPSTLPAEAYARDLERLRQPGPIGPYDDAWVMLAHALSRSIGMPDAVIRATAAEAADMIAVSAVASGLGRHSTIMRAASALRSLADPEAPGSQREEQVVAELAVATQAVAADLEIAGAFELAYATLHSLLRGFVTRLTPRHQGNILAQLGRAARQLAAIDVAREMYEEAMAIGYDADAMDVVARAQLGLGVTALMLGNYPSAREHFQRAMLNADRANDPELLRSAHHGLFNCGFASGDLDAAMVHGWNVLRLCIAPDSRAEALMNMGEICRMTGEHDAAIRTYAVAVEWTSSRRVRVHALSGALQSAVACGRLSEARRYLAELDVELPLTPDTYARAVVGVEIADSLHRLGDHAGAEAHLRDALALATANAYHEVAHRAEQASSTWNAAPQSPSVRSQDHRGKRQHRSESFRMVLRSLNGLTATSL